MLRWYFIQIFKYLKFNVGHLKLSKLQLDTKTGNKVLLFQERWCDTDIGSAVPWTGLFAFETTFLLFDLWDNDQLQ